MSRICTAAILAVGFAVVYGTVVAYLSEVGFALQRRGEPPPSWSAIVVDASGTPLIRTYLGNNVDFQTLDGDPVASVAENTLMNGAGFEATDPRLERFYGRRGWQGRVFAFADNQSPPVYWYLVTDDDAVRGRGYFVGFKSLTRQRFGYIGREGYSANRPDIAREFIFYTPSLHRGGTLLASSYYDTRGLTPASGRGWTQSHFAFASWIVYFLSEGRLLKIDLNEHTVVPALPFADALAVRKASRPRTDITGPLPQGAAQHQVRFAVHRADRIVLLNPVGDSMIDYFLPDELKTADFTFYPVDDDIALAVITRWTGQYRYSDNTLIWFNRAGEITRRHESRLDRGRIRESPVLQQIQVAATSPSPLALSLVPALPGFNIEHAPLRELIVQALPAILLVLTVAVVVTVMAARWQRKYGLPRSYAWLAFVFVFGLPGFVGYLLHRRWPIRELAPPPQPTGIEIFA